MGGKADRAKHLHHYVPCRYLRAWSRDGRTIAVRFGDGKVRMVAIDRIAFEDGGYSYDNLTPEMLRFVLCCKPRSNRITDMAMRGFFLPTIVVPVFYRKLAAPADGEIAEMWNMILSANLIDETGMKVLDSIYQLFNADSASCEKLMHDYQKEGYETMMCSIENKAWPILDSLLKGNLEWIGDEKLAFRMFYYICTQRTRSPAFKKMMADMYKLKLAKTSKDFAAGGLYRRHILAIDSTAILMSVRHKLTFKILRVEGTTEFISGDLPVIAVWGEGYYDYYFPLSPDRALLFGPRKDFDTRNATLLRGDVESVRILNQAIKRNAVLQTYGASERVLNEL